MFITAIDLSRTFSPRQKLYSARLFLHLLLHRHRLPLMFKLLWVVIYRDTFFMVWMTIQFNDSMLFFCFSVQAIYCSKNNSFFLSQDSELLFLDTIILSRVEEEHFVLYRFSLMFSTKNHWIFVASLLA